MRKHAPSSRLQPLERWKRPVAACALGLLGACCGGLASADPQPPAPVAETYTSEYEKAPHPNFVEQENTTQWAQTEQDRYRLRVVLPDNITPEQESSLGADTSQSSQAS